MPDDGAWKDTGGLGANSEEVSHDDVSPDAASSATGITYFDVEDLDENEKNLVLFMCLCSYLDWQDRFADAYKELLIQRSLETGSKDPPSKDALYTIMREAMVQQRRFMRSGEPFDDDDVSVASDDIERPSFLRILLRDYNLEMYVKIMLLSFLLKMPAYSYIIVTTCYCLYVLIAISIVRISRLPLFNWWITRKIINGCLYTYRTTGRVISYVRGFVAPGDTDIAGNVDTPVTDTSNDLPNQVEVSEPREATAVQRPSRFAKAMYQVLGAYFFSIMPWWEPNPLYIEEAT
uniref:Uncharacterized protein n=2 Tax=Babesia bovis TaxID=5865 RepID=A7AQS4_BABBO|eukprot:XP_001610461.1 hypothetical protein [Babesia bovis T2Bo]